MPPSLRECLPADDLTRFLSDRVDDFDLSASTPAYEQEQGYPPYHPVMLTTVASYTDCVGAISSTSSSGY